VPGGHHRARRPPSTNVSASGKLVYGRSSRSLSATGMVIIHSVRRRREISLRLAIFSVSCRCNGDQEDPMGLLDTVLGGTRTSGGMSPITMALLGVLAYRTFQGKGRLADMLGRAPAASPSGGASTTTPRDGLGWWNSRRHSERRSRRPAQAISAERSGRQSSIVDCEWAEQAGVTE
jgi:hypothetical protein